MRLFNIKMLYDANRLIGEHPLLATAFTITMAYFAAVITPGSRAANSQPDSPTKRFPPREPGTSFSEQTRARSTLFNNGPAKSSEAPQGHSNNYAPRHS